MVKKLHHLHIPPTLLHWIQNFLSSRPRAVINMDSIIVSTDRNCLDLVEYWKVSHHLISNSNTYGVSLIGVSEPIEHLEVWHHWIFLSDKNLTFLTGSWAISSSVGAHGIIYKTFSRLTPSLPLDTSRQWSQNTLFFLSFLSMWTILNKNDLNSIAHTASEIICLHSNSNS